jgi:alpha-beta hydrolase superfamily lysophospholipase
MIKTCKESDMRILSRLVAALLTVGTVTAVSSAPALADPIPCDQQCQWQWDQQRQNALPRTDFYDPPNPLRWAPAGALIRQQDTNEYRVGGEPTTATRILYHSRTSAGRDVAASGVMLLPAGTPPPGGWPVVVDAHGSSGFGVNCAPSLMRDLYHGDQMRRFVQRGWAIVAPDYAGLGTTGKDEFVNKTAEANDVLNAVRAAHQARSDLSEKWVLWGHSQGGGAALSVAERQVSQPEPGYLGAVVTSPAADLTKTTASVAGTPGLGGFVPLIADGAKVTDPETPLGQVLSPQAMQLLGTTRTGCLQVVFAVYNGLTGTDLVRPAYLSEPHFARFLNENSTGQRPVRGPVLLLQGDADWATPRPITDHVAATLCQAGAELDYRTYPGLGHDTYPGVQTGIDDGAMSDILAWTADRFAGKSATTTCL